MKEGDRGDIDLSRIPFMKEGDIESEKELGRLSEKRKIA